MISNGFFALLIFSFSVSFSTTSSVAQTLAQTTSQPSAPSASQSAVQTNSQSSASAAEDSDIFMMCRRDKSIRWLRAYKLETGKCKTIYSKEGYLQVVSSATYFSSCEAVLQSVRKNIEEGGFTCQPTSSVQMAELE